MRAKGHPASRIAGMGRAVPEKILSNSDLEKMVDTSDEWITTRSGIKRRHVAEKGTALSDLASKAAEEALNNAGMSPLQVDLIVIGTVTGDAKFPASAVYVQSKIGAKNAVAYDISGACSGWLYAMQLGDMAIKTGQAKCVLVIGGEILTSMVDWSDRSTCVLFGDAAGAALLVPSTDNRGILSMYIQSNGDLADLLYCEGGGSVYPGWDKELDPKRFYLKMAGNEVFKHAVNTMGDAAVTALDLAGISSDDIDLLVPHQANIRIINATAKRLKVPREKILVNIHEYGNTSSASIPNAIAEAMEEGKIKDGTLVVCVTFGGGFTWASAVIRF